MQKDANERHETGAERCAEILADRCDPPLAAQGKASLATAGRHNFARDCQKTAFRPALQAALSGAGFKAGIER
jgi:hypothetical protein